MNESSKEATMKQQTPHGSELARLSDTDLVLSEEQLDIRNRKVVDRHGAEIGHVDNLFIDQKERKVRMLQIRAGGILGLGERHFLLPVDAITSVADDEVHVNVTLERIVGSPVYDPSIVPAPTQQSWGSYYGYYGYTPYWSAGYTYPRFTARPDESAREGRYVR